MQCLQGHSLETASNPKNRNDAGSKNKNKNKTASKAAVMRTKAYHVNKNDDMSENGATMIGRHNPVLARRV